MTEAELASYPVDDPHSTVDWSDGGTVLAFVNEVAGGRRLLEALRERVDAGADAVAVAAPQNQPVVGQIVDRDEIREAALSRVEVTQSVLVGRGHGSRALAGARRCRARLRPARGAALVPL